MTGWTKYSTTLKKKQEGWSWTNQFWGNVQSKYYNDDSGWFITLNMQDFCFFSASCGTEINKQNNTFNAQTALHSAPSTPYRPKKKKSSQYFFFFVWATVTGALWETNKKVVSGVALENDAQLKRAGHLNSAGRTDVLWELLS